MLFSTPVMAVEPITGAFGLKLGDVWDGEATETYERDGFFQYDFIPESPHDLFDRYAVHVTLVKKLIFGIGGHKKGECEQQYQDLKKALIKKYGAGEELGDTGHSWEQGKRKLEDPDVHPSFTSARGITIHCNVEEDEWVDGLYIHYVDLDIHDSRTDELLPDTSNL